MPDPAATRVVNPNIHLCIFGEYDFMFPRWTRIDRGSRVFPSYLTRTTPSATHMPAVNAE